MNIKARFALANLVATWEEKFCLTLEDATDLLKREHEAHVEALKVLRGEERDSLPTSDFE